jgi:hypothetical protein
VRSRARRAACLLLAACFSAFVAEACEKAAEASEEPADWDGESTCVTCHEVDVSDALSLPVPEWSESVHAAHEVSCDACHGGDPRLEDADASMSEEAGFLDNPSWTEMADYCGVCHEAIAASYQNGRFGRAVEEGVRAATCATCHMQDGHRILAAVPAEIVTRESCPGCPGVADPERCVRMLEEVRAERASLLAGIAGVEARGIELSDFRRGVGQVHDAFERAVHEFDDESLDAARALAVAQYRGLGEQVAALDREADGRRRLGVALLGGLALLFAALWKLARTPAG